MRSISATDFDAALKAVADIGYKNVELAAKNIIVATGAREHDGWLYVVAPKGRVLSSGPGADAGSGADVVKVSLRKTA